MQIRLLHGDCVARMAEMPEGSIDTIICDPPYNLTLTGSTNPGRRSWTMFNESGRTDPVPEGKARRQRKEAHVTTGFMQMPWDGSDVALSPEFWSQVFRVLKLGGCHQSLWSHSNFPSTRSGDGRAGVVGVHLEAWGYGSGMPKSHPIAAYMDRMLVEGKSRRIHRKGVGNLNGKFAEAGRGFVSQSKAHILQTDVAKSWAGWGTALKPAWEPVLVGTKPIGIVTPPPPGAP